VVKATYDDERRFAELRDEIAAKITRKRLPQR
jgi:hypothetical protein